MNKKDSTVYLKHIADAISRIEEYVEDVDYDEFMQNSLVQDGVIRQLEIIGEAVKNLSPAVRQEYPLVPWSQLAGLRDKLIHAYFMVNLDLVWQAVTLELPDLKTQIEAALIKLDQPPKTSQIPL